MHRRQPTDESHDISDASIKRQRHREAEENHDNVSNRLRSQSGMDAHSSAPTPTRDDLIARTRHRLIHEKIARDALKFSKDLEIQSRYQRVHELIQTISDSALEVSLPGDKKSDEKMMSKWKGELVAVLEPEEDPQKYYKASRDRSHDEFAQIMEVLLLWTHQRKEMVRSFLQTGHIERTDEVASIRSMKAFLVEKNGFLGRMI